MVEKGQNSEGFMEKMMDVMQIQSFGGPEVLRLQKIPVPQPGTREILVKVRAASVNPVDYKIRLGKYPVVKEGQLPYVLGRDFAGEVELLGEGVSAFDEGELVYALTDIDHGCFAQYVLVKQEALAPKPERLNFVAAAAVPLAGLTAWQGIFDQGGLQPGQTVLIHGGSGGVGHFAIQFAKAKGATVLTTVSSEHVDFAKALGADEVIDHKKQRFEELARDMDVVFDLIGGETEDRSWGVLKKGGILVSTLMQPSQEKAAEYGVRGVRFTAQGNGAELREIAALIDAGKVKPTVLKTFPLKEASAALGLVQQGHTQGKVVLTVDQKVDKTIPKRLDNPFKNMDHNQARKSK
jgi:NADPH:quinone reductase-like Zn-dependent oxidoreductase